MGVSGVQLAPWRGARIAWVGRALLFGGPLLWIGAVNIAPLIEMARISLLDVYPAAPDHPLRYSLDNYASFIASPIYRGAFLRGIAFAAVTTVLALLICYPLAYGIAFRAPPRRRLRCLLLLIAPFWTSEIIRIFAIMLLLADHGAVNLLLRWLGVVEAPLPLLYNAFSVGFGMLYAVLLVMLLPLYAALDRLPVHLVEAAANLGAGPWVRLLRLTLPLTRDGIAAGCALAFLVSLGSFAVPMLLGGPGTTLFSMTIASLFASSAGRWPVGAAFALVMLVSGLAMACVLMGLAARRRAIRL